MCVRGLFAGVVMVFGAAVASAQSGLVVERLPGESFSIGNAALDLPQVQVAVFLPGMTDPQESLFDLGDFFDDLFSDPIFDGAFDFGGLLGSGPFTIEGFTDTGASVVTLGPFTAANFLIPKQLGATFTDVGIGGTETFDISTPLNFAIAPATPSGSNNDIANYSLQSSNIQAAVDAADLSGDLTDFDAFLAAYSEFNVFGMPLLEGRTMVIDARGLNAFALGDTSDPDALPVLVNRLYNHGTGPAWNPDSTDEPGVPDWDEVDLVMDLDFADFGPLTTTTNGTPPTIAHNPMVGGGLPDLVNETIGDASDSAPGITLGFAGLTIEVSALFDTGGSISVINPDVLDQIGFAIQRDAQGAVTGVTADDGSAVETFELQVAGVGDESGSTLIGVILDELTLPTYFIDENGVRVERPLTFEGVPFAIADISIDNGVDSYTLPAVLGVNTLLASAFVDGAIDPTGVGDLTILPGLFDFIIYDETDNRVGLTFASFIPEPGTAAALGVLTVTLLVRRR